jgi:branched-chain amino acid transport system ATP-binding protein
MLAVRELGVSYAGATALDGVSLDVRTGELIALVGANGAGKSSLLAAVSGLHRPVSGSIRLGDDEISALPAHRISRLGLALVPEGRRLFAQLSVERNLLLGDFRGRDGEGRRQQLEHVFELFPVLSERLQQPAGTLSGGEQQMLALGRGLMGRPRLLMLDEPSLGVAPKLVSAIFDALRQVNEEGTTVLVIEQNVRRALELADRGYVIQSGRIVASGPSEKLLESDEVRRAYLGM